MTAATKPQATEYERLIKRLKGAASELSSAADSAADAVASLDDLREQPVAAVPESELADAIRRLHDDEHDGPLQWCAREVCRLAWEATS